MSTDRADGAGRRVRFARRDALAALSALPLVGAVGSGAAAARSVAAAEGRETPTAQALARAGVTVHPRAEWGGDLHPTGPMAEEADVRVLTVHHSASPNTYERSRVPVTLRGFFAFHTGPEKAWPDVAYSFFVDRFGEVWEGRTGSLARPVEGSATGHNQGYTRLVCLIGDFAATVPSDAMVHGLTGLLAALADVHGIDTAPGATASFVSRGSNKWPKGRTVTVPTICGHRRLSLTACPGDRAAALIDSGELARLVTARRR